MSKYAEKYIVIALFIVRGVEGKGAANYCEKTLVQGLFATVRKTFCVVLVSSSSISNDNSMEKCHTDVCVYQVHYNII